MKCAIGGAALPVLFDVDAVVVGGSFAGVSCAERLARAGNKVLVIEQRTYLGRELTATLRPWLPAGDDGFAPLHPDRLKRGLEDRLFAHGVQLLYATLPIAVLERDGRAAGLVVANKSGRQAIMCRSVVDATETALVATLLGERVEAYAPGATALYSRTLEFTEAAEGEALVQELAVPDELGLRGGVVRLRRGVRGEGHVYAEFALELPSGNTLAAERGRFAASRHAGMRLAAYLAQQVPAFRKAFLASSSYELHGPFPLEGAATAAPGAFADECGAPIGGVWSLAKPLFARGDAALHDVSLASKLGERAADEALAFLAGAAPSAGSVMVRTQAAGDGAVPSTPYDVASPSFVLADDGRPRADVPAMLVPAASSGDVLVVGGGSSGASASIAAAKEGARTLLVDMNPGLGGTGTFGGVDSYWFGKRHGYAAAITERVHEVQERIGYKGHKWNIEAKMYALLREAEEAGVELTLQAITFGAVLEGSRVRGVVAATRWGPIALLAEAVVDATGDGDIAAYAGADFVYGSEKDRTVMWFSLAQFQQPGKTKNNFTSMVDVSDALDYTRAIVAGRRRGDASYHDHGIYIATRESRHIAGDVTMKLTDQLLQRKWPDAVNVHFSNHDVKGVSGAPWINVGLIPPNLEIEIPYRMLLPAGLEGLLVAGKAVSATHDALPAIRMQSDLENLGAVAALAATMAARGGTTPRAIDVKALQARLVREGLLPEDVLTRSLAPIRYTDEELERLVDRIETEPLYAYAEMRMNEVYRETIPFVEICSAGPRIVPVLTRALATADGIRRVRIAQALSMLGSPEGVPTLRDAILEMLQGDTLPVRTADMMYVQLPPDHGAMPDAAYLLYSLALAADPRSVPVWERVAELFDPTEDDFKDPWKGVFYYVDAVCQGAERLGDRAAVPALKRLRRIPFLRDQQARDGAQPDYFLERRAMLEVAIGRALARCGDAEGYDVLIGYLSDNRALLRQNALLELRRLSGFAFGAEPSLWAAWAAESRPYERTAPLELRLDFEQDSEAVPRRSEATSTSGGIRA
ncbi:FAD-dependent oxidoreductase [Paenibacillus antri]|nr:FAD-dependent oxidoreductase [Paenibacillus antri]